METVTIEIPAGYGKMAANYALEAVKIAIREDEQKKVQVALGAEVETKVEAMTAVDSKGVDLLRSDPDIIDPIVK